MENNVIGPEGTATRTFLEAKSLKPARVPENLRDPRVFGNFMSLVQKWRTKASEALSLEPSNGVIGAYLARIDDFIHWLETVNRPTITVINLDARVESPWYQPSSQRRPFAYTGGPVMRG